VIFASPSHPGGLKEMGGDACHRRSPGQRQGTRLHLRCRRPWEHPPRGVSQVPTTFRCGLSPLCSILGGPDDPGGRRFGGRAGLAGSRPRRSRSLGPWLTSPVSCPSKRQRDHGLHSSAGPLLDEYKVN